MKKTSITLLLAALVSCTAFSQGVKISKLPSASSLNGTEEVPIVQNGTTVKTTLNSIIQSVEAGIEDAPDDGKMYVRKGLDWREIFIPPVTVTSAAIDTIRDGGDFNYRLDMKGMSFSSTEQVYLYFVGTGFNMEVSISFDQGSIANQSLSINANYIPSGTYIAFFATEKNEGEIDNVYSNVFEFTVPLSYE